MDLSRPALRQGRKRSNDLQTTIRVRKIYIRKRRAYGRTPAGIGDLAWNRPSGSHDPAARRTRSQDNTNYSSRPEYRIHHKKNTSLPWLRFGHEGYPDAHSKVGDVITTPAISTPDPPTTRIGSRASVTMLPVTFTRSLCPR
jgi:hypothetical protein